MCGACNGRVDPEWCAHAHENCNTQLSWPDRVWNADDQVWEFVICCHCVGATSQFCAEHGGGLAVILQLLLDTGTDKVGRVLLVLRKDGEWMRMISMK
jgi:hypothetical protein